MHAAALLPVVVLAAGAAAQIGARVAQPPSGLERGGSWDPPGPRGSRGHGTGADLVGPCAEGELWWYWNRDRWLPAPRRLSRRAEEVATDRVGTGAVDPVRTWLRAAARSYDVGARAGAIYALGCAGPAAGGLPLIVAAADDPHAEVRESALLALGEHAGATARFRLVAAAQDGARAPRERAIAVVAYGLAAALDGDVGGLALRRFAAGAVDADLRAAVCAADVVHGRAVLAPVAGEWVLDERDPLASAVTCAAAGWQRADVVRRLQGLLGAKDAAVQLAARAAAVAYGALEVEALLSWREGASRDRVARSILAAAPHPRFVELATVGFDQASLRGVCALALAVHARVVGRAGVPSLLRRASGRMRTFDERPLWLLAGGLAGDPTAAGRARAVLVDERSPERMRLAAADVLALAGGEALTTLRPAVVLDPSPAVRLRAADGLARHAGRADVQLLLDAIGRPGAVAERAELLVALGRTRDAAVVATLRRHCRDGAASAAERAGAWLGLAHCLRWSGAPRLSELPHGVAYGYLPPFLLELADAHR